MIIMMADKKHSGQRLGIDVEGTIVDIFTPLLNTAREKYKSTDTKESIANDGINYAFSNIPHQIVRDICTKLWHENTDLKLIDDAIPSIISSFRENGDSVIICTATYANPKEVKKWLDNHDIKYDAFIYVDKQESKVQLRLDAIIDDNAAVINSFSNAGNRGIFLKGWWNHGELPTITNSDLSVVVSSWMEAKESVDKFRSLLRKKED